MWSRTYLNKSENWHEVSQDKQRFQDHLRSMRKPTKKPLNHALNVTNYSEARTMFQAIETEYTIIKMTSNAITVMLNFQRHLENVNLYNGSQEDPGVVNIVNNENIVFKCPDCNQEYQNKRSLKRHQKKWSWQGRNCIQLLFLCQNLQYRIVSHHLPTRLMNSLDNLPV